MSPALELDHLHMGFGGLQVTRDVSLVLQDGARHALIGPNGAGKTTLVNLVTGQLRPRQGRVRLCGRDVTALPPHARARLGLIRNFQITSLFPSFSAFENIALAILEREGLGLSLRTARGFPAAIVAEAEALGVQFRLGAVGNRKLRDLPYGQQRLVEIAVALAMRPRVLMLDEPAAGLPAADHAVILDVVDRLPGDVAVLLIEHDMALVFRFATEITVLAEGAVLARGTPADIRANPAVRAAYLGHRGGVGERV
jgi:ABC-type branched-subunit amino acid transport system ATPase component